MNSICKELVHVALKRAEALVDFNIYDDLIKRIEFEQHIILDDKSLNEDEKLDAIRIINKDGGFSEIYLADWIDGSYNKWDSKEQILKVKSTYHKVVLKRLEVTGSINWFDEIKSHLTLSNKWFVVVKCYGVTQDPSDGNYMLVMHRLDINLEKYLRQYYDKLTWKIKIQIIYYIVRALIRIHKENVIHRDLHSRNILYLQKTNHWYISDLGLCGPVNKSLKSIYGNLPYVAPEVIIEKEYSRASDIYSIGILMWEISTGQLPFADQERDYSLAMNIINGMRPKIKSGTPLLYQELMEQCWDVDPKKRPDTDTLWSKIHKMNKACYEENTNSNDIIINSQLNNISPSTINLSVERFSEIHTFEDLSSEQRNIIEDSQEVSHMTLRFQMISKKK
ncbi:kinase-like domain-containing protein [Rhizophagus irregularis DAOM 181602=DAOM 197198]|nr:kinase-like domain-containing protein [Rhizophagus irregularis DAOM 181602=DAOM 197198]